MKLPGDMVVMSNQIGMIIAAHHANSGACQTSKHAENVSKLRELVYYVFLPDGIKPAYNWQLEDVSSVDAR